MAGYGGKPSFRRGRGKRKAGADAITDSSSRLLVGNPYGDTPSGSSPHNPADGGKRIPWRPGDASEAEYQAAVRQQATARGWLVFADTDSRRSVAGYPDLTLAKTGVGVAFAELKVGAGRVRPEQQQWLDTLAGAGATARLWAHS